MQTVLTSRSRWLAGLPVALVALTAWLAVPSTAAADQLCYGSITPIKPSGERDTGVDYEFACREPVSAYFLVSSRELSAFDVSADVFDPQPLGGAIRGDDRFGECEGATPSYGFGCTGTYSSFGRLIRASFDTTDPACARDKTTNKLTLSAQVIVGDAKGRLSGPYRLARPKACNRAPFVEQQAPASKGKPSRARR